MENPYDENQILRLISRKSESLKVDLKREFDLSDNQKKSALIKDILAMANTIEPDDSLRQMGLDPNYGIIIFGADENGNFYDISEKILDDADIQNIINQHVEPRINFLFYSFDVQGQEGVKKIGAIIIPPSERPPHRVPRGYKGVLVPGLCLKRQGTSNFDKISDYEFEQMFTWRAQFSELENRLQQEDYQLKDSERARFRHTFIDPLENSQRNVVKNKLLENKFLFICGEPGIGKRSLAINLAEELLEDQEAFRLLYLSRFIPLNDLSGVDGAVIIIPDIFGYRYLERPDFETDQRIIEELLQSNYIITTSPLDILEEVLNETRIEEWDVFQSNQVLLEARQYSQTIKSKIFKNHVEWARQNGKLTAKQTNFVIHGLDSDSENETKNSLLKLRLPAQIRRLIDFELPKVKTRNQLLDVLNNQLTLEREIYSWFVKLDQNTQCFIMTLAIFHDLASSDFQYWYQLIVRKLRTYNPMLAILPFGTASINSEPYVENLYDRPSFVDREVQDVILTVIGKTYRTYFSLLIDDFISAVVPKVMNDQIFESELTRRSVTAAAIQIAKIDYQDLRSLIIALSDAKRGNVSVKAAEILSSATHNKNQLNSVFDLLRDWLGSDDSKLMYRKWTAIVTLGKVDRSNSRQVIDILFNCVNKERNPYVRSAIPRSIKPFVNSNPQKSKQILSQLAADKHNYTRRRVSLVVKELAYREPDFVNELIHSWASLESERRLWTLFRACILITTPRLKETCAEIFGSHLEKNEKVLQEAFVDAITRKDLKSKQAWSLFSRVVHLKPESSRKLSALATIVKQSNSSYSWDQIEKWVYSSEMDLRVSAAYILSNWKVDAPERAAPFLQVLTSDINMEVALAAQLEPFVSVPEHLFRVEEETFDEEEDLSEEQKSEDSKNAEEISLPKAETPYVIYFETDILG